MKIEITRMVRVAGVAHRVGTVLDIDESTGIQLVAQGVAVPYEEKAPVLEDRAEKPSKILGRKKAK